MARKIKVFLIDDIDGSENAETVEFAYAGTSYSIDLSEENREKFDAALAPYLAKATKVSSGRGRKAATKSSADLGSVREWAKANGYEVSNRGRVPASVMEAYKAAGG